MKKTLVAFLWHMHQPDYTLPGEGRHLLPWVRLHATKAYFDMPWLLERFEDIRATINFSGSLLSQLRAYTRDGARDLWWELCEKPAESLKPNERHFVLEHFFSINWDRHIKTVPAFWRLLKRRGTDPRKIREETFTAQEIRDLQVYFNLAWMGFAARREYPLVQRLLAKGGGHSHDDLQDLLNVQIEIMGRLVPMYRALADRGQIELTTTPMYHPILPLIVDTDAARRATPDRPLPRRCAQPDDAQWHVEAAVRQFEETFGHRPAGMWPSEGSVSPEVMPIFARSNLGWVASDEEVLMASAPHPHGREDALYRPYSVETPEGEVAIVFRDHTLSDLIGFTYATTAAEAAARDMLSRLRDGSRKASATQNPLVSIILDGENPWESYPADGEAFLRALYSELGGAPDVETVLLKDATASLPTTRLRHLHSGSWIRANYQIWIGAKETNEAWNLLGETRDWLEQERRAQKLSEDDPGLLAALEAIHSAQGSDWFWWYGDDFTSGQDKVFDSLFRAYLRTVYTALGASPPASLHRSISTSSERKAVVSPSALIHPTIDGVNARYFDWSGAGRYEPRGGAGSMYRAGRYVETIHFGFNLETLFIRFDPDEDFLKEPSDEMAVELLIQIGGAEGRSFVAQIDLDSAQSSWALVELSAPPSRREVPKQGTMALERIFELALPFSWLEVDAGDTCSFSLALFRRGIEVDRQPPHGGVSFTVPGKNFETDNWLV